CHGWSSRAPPSRHPTPPRSASAASPRRAPASPGRTAKPRPVAGSNHAHFHPFLQELPKPFPRVRFIRIIRFREALVLSRQGQPQRPQHPEVQYQPAQGGELVDREGEELSEEERDQRRERESLKRRHAPTAE